MSARSHRNLMFKFTDSLRKWLFFQRDFGVLKGKSELWPSAMPAPRSASGELLFFPFLFAFNFLSRHVPSAKASPHPEWTLPTQGSSRVHSLAWPSGLSDYCTWRLWSRGASPNKLMGVEKRSLIVFETSAKTAKHPKLQRWKTTAMRNCAQPCSLL